MVHAPLRRDQRRRDHVFIHLLPTVIVFVAFFGLTLWSSANANQSVKQTQARALDQNMRQVRASIQNTIRAYDDILLAGAGLFGASQEVNRDEWGAFIANFDLRERYPGVQSVGYVQIAGATAPVTYIEPATADNQRVLGFDMYSEPIRRQGMQLARDNATATISETVYLKQDSGAENPQPGLLMYIAVYKRDAPLQTVAQRRAAITGYVYAAFRSHELLRTSTTTHSAFAFRVNDSQPSGDITLYQTDTFKAALRQPNELAAKHSFAVNNQTWTLQGAIDETVVSELERNRPSTTLWGGTLFSLFVAGFIYLLLVNRTRALAHKEDEQIRGAKDDLLALASHQLRTPATGVKQYIGMLLEGYGGKVTDEQRTFLGKAYASNERQLATINEMLFVAKADSGRISLRPSRFNIAEVVDEIIEERAPSIKERKQTIAFKKPARGIQITADRLYVRMAVENIISNAYNYTPPGGSISVVLRVLAKQIVLDVRDTGIGLAEQDQALLFKKFSRIPNKLTDKVDGSGIGLYLARRIIEAHGGDISFTSKPNIGTTFTITLPKNYQLGGTNKQPQKEA